MLATLGCLAFPAVHAWLHSETALADHMAYEGGYKGYIAPGTGRYWGFRYESSCHLVKFLLDALAGQLLLQSPQR